ncbi:hypothetical protein MYXA107069_37660 [Myxococcus xanthus]
MHRRQRQDVLHGVRLSAHEDVLHVQHDFRPHQPRAQHVRGEGLDVEGPQHPRHHRAGWVVVGVAPVVVAAHQVPGQQRVRLQGAHPYEVRRVASHHQVLHHLAPVRELVPVLLAHQTAPRLPSPHAQSHRSAQVDLEEAWFDDLQPRMHLKEAFVPSGPSPRQQCPRRGLQAQPVRPARARTGRGWPLLYQGIPLVHGRLEQRISACLIGVDFLLGHVVFGIGNLFRPSHVG